MARVRAAIRSYPFVAVTILVGTIGLVLLATPAHAAVPWLVGGYALAIAAWQAIGMVRQLLRGHAGLDILAVTAIVAAVWSGEHWAALVVVLMLTGGEALEDYAQNRSQSELTALLAQAPQLATRVTGDDESTWQAIDIDDVAVGDTLLVRPGERVPVDAILLEAAAFDESSLTGESLPVDRVPGELVPSGAVNGQSAVRVRAAALAGASQYQQIVALVQQAQLSKARTVRLADRYAVPFTVLSLAIAGIAWAISGQAVRFAEVLVVATPCPLLIAAPVAFLGGMSRAAKTGLIVKGGSVLEQLARVRSVAFDKTGTLTTGRPEPRRIMPAPGFTDDEVLALAASAEVYSSHVLAGAVVATAKQRGLQLLAVSSAQEQATDGVAAQTANGTVRVGKPAWLARTATDFIAAQLEPGELAIYVALDETFAGAIIMRDRLRPDAVDTVATLRRLGVERMAVVTGDVAATAEPIAAQTGITEVHAECHPADKVRIVSGIQPRPLLMVGDGLNDAPVLAAADVGFAMGAKGATAASESADVVNRFDHLAAVADAVRVGRDTVRIALQSIWIGILISVALMVVAAFGLLPALLGAWLQEAVDLVAILWALRALRPS
ncbi:heavy metal translocating P-type ATPase [Nakamurella lactea]|uniref:heavy metal translocating P-type ATPase n=1 Tax=Nakamurella lactea TaxID=459515 RepID=UPI00055FCB22|nr:heavy metal translocating P-type ATPase [Nakamurella lactea]